MIQSIFAVIGTALVTSGIIGFIVSFKVKRMKSSSQEEWALFHQALIRNDITICIGVAMIAQKYLL